MPATPAWLAPLEGALNRNISTQAQAAALLRRLEGKTLRLDIQGLLQVCATATPGHLALLAAEGEEADATISAPPGALLGLLTGTPGAQAGSVQVRGDAEVAAQYRELFSLSRPDPEEELARLVGDVAARRLGNAARSFGHWVRGVARSGSANLAEYLTEEGRDVATRTELAEFAHGVDETRDRCERLEARLRRLERSPLPGGAS